MTKNIQQPTITESINTNLEDKNFTLRWTSVVSILHIFTQKLEKKIVVIWGHL